MNTASKEYAGVLDPLLAKMPNGPGRDKAEYMVQQTCDRFEYTGCLRGCRVPEEESGSKGQAFFSVAVRREADAPSIAPAYTKKPLRYHSQMLTWRYGSWIRSFSISLFANNV